MEVSYVRDSNWRVLGNVSLTLVSWFTAHTRTRYVKRHLPQVVDIADKAKRAGGRCHRPNANFCFFFVFFFTAERARSFPLVVDRAGFVLSVYTEDPSNRRGRYSKSTLLTQVGQMENSAYCLFRS
jgi:hypothetical protein